MYRKKLHITKYARFFFKFRKHDLWQMFGKSTSLNFCTEKKWMKKRSKMFFDFNITQKIAPFRNFLHFFKKKTLISLILLTKRNQKYLIQFNLRSSNVLDFISDSVHFYALTFTAIFNGKLIDFAFQLISSAHSRKLIFECKSAMKYEWRKKIIWKNLKKLEETCQVLADPNINAMKKRLFVYNKQTGKGDFSEVHLSSKNKLAPF